MRPATSSSRGERPSGESESDPVDDGGANSQINVAYIKAAEATYMCGALSMSERTVEQAGR